MAPAGASPGAGGCLGRTLTYIMLSTLTARSSLNCGASCSRTAFRKPPIVSPLRTATCSRWDASQSQAVEQAAQGCSQQPRTWSSAAVCCCVCQCAAAQPQVLSSQLLARWDGNMPGQASHLSSVSAAIPVAVGDLQRLILNGLLLRRPLLQAHARSHTQACQQDQQPRDPA